MSDHLQSTLTDKGQTTVPVEVREALGVKPRQQLEWSIRKDGSAVVRPRPSALELFGSLKPKGKASSPREEKHAIRRLVAEQAAKEGR